MGYNITNCANAAHGRELVYMEGDLKRSAAEQAWHAYRNGRMTLADANATQQLYTDWLTWVRQQPWHQARA